MQIQADKMKSVRLFQRATFVVFLALGILYIALEIMRNNGYQPDDIYILQKSLDLPFAFAALGYGLSSVRLTFADSDSKSLDNWLIIIGAVIMIVFIAANLYMPDA